MIRRGFEMLYSASSYIRVSNKYKLKCYWFYVERKLPIAPYEHIIKDYDPLKCKDAETSVNEFFTGLEIEMLRNYISDLSLEVKEVDLPLPSNCIPLSHSPSGGGEGYYLLSEQEDYNLPFKVWGYYDSKNPDDLLECSDEEKGNGLK